MTTDLHWSEIALRLALTIGVGLLLGYNRAEHGKAAGMRTTVLVCLAASAAMIQVNILLPTSGRTPDSFVTNDLMRLPLGILTGVGFIGGGAILRRENMVTGVTTAATLWLVTVIGLCLGGGQIGLGLATAGLGFCALWGLKWLESRLHQEHTEFLGIELDPDGPDEEALRRLLAAHHIDVVGTTREIDHAHNRRKIDFNVRRLRRMGDFERPAILDELVRLRGVVTLKWTE